MAKRLHRMLLIAALPACLPAVACDMAAIGDLVGSAPPPTPVITDAGAPNTDNDALPPGIPEGLGPDGGAALPGMPASCLVDAGSVKATFLVDIPAGPFQMGCAAADTQCSADENPQHTVTLSEFAMDTTEVTQAQYALCVQAGKCDLPRCEWDPCKTPDLPIACIYRATAMAYCAFVGERLPTEAEWEKAARGTDGRIYPWGDDPPTCELATNDECDGGLTPVGSLPKGASPYGVLDMEGNVVEWTLDVFDPGYYAVSVSTNPPGPLPPTDGGEVDYVGRGGGWHSDVIWDRASARDNYQTTYVRDSMGLRCAGDPRLVSPTLAP